MDHSPKQDVDSPLLNQSGQAMGTKGRNTRQRLIDATVSLLECRPLREVRVSDIVRDAQSSVPTFYRYFRDVPEAVLAAVAALPQSTPEMLRVIEGWTMENGHEQARAFVTGYIAHWDRHRVLFRVRNLASEEGDQRFVDSRAQSIYPLLRAIAAQIERTESRGRIPADISALAAAGALVAMIERVAATAHNQSHDVGMTFEGLISATAYIVAITLEGRPLPTG
ncbi:MAG: TetR family transcriptional regulator [Sphingobium sp.]